MCEKQEAKRKILQESVEKVKRDRKMGRKYMTAEIYRKGEFLTGQIEGQVHAIIRLLSKTAPVPEHLTERLSSISNEKILDELLERALDAKSISEFEEILNGMNL